MQDSQVIFYDFTWANERLDQDAYAVSRDGTVILLSEADERAAKVACTECQSWAMVVPPGPVDPWSFWSERAYDEETGEAYYDREMEWETIDDIPLGAWVCTDGGWHRHASRRDTLNRIGYR